MPVAFTSPDRIKCDGCGVPTPAAMLDAKPFRGATLADQHHAADTGADFDWLECQTCYGPNWSPL